MRAILCLRIIAQVIVAVIISHSTIASGNTDSVADTNLQDNSANDSPAALLSKSDHYVPTNGTIKVPDAIVNTGDLCNVSSISHPPRPCIIPISPNATSNASKDSSNKILETLFDKPVKKTESGASHIHYGWFIDGAAAIFGILAVVFALFVLLLGFKGWGEFGKLMEKVNDQVIAKLDASVENRVDTFVKTELIPRLEGIFQEKHSNTIKKLDVSIADEIDNARKLLKTEISTILSTEEIRRQIVDQAVIEIGRKLSPSAPPSQPDEFEPEVGGK